jgi:cytochrome c oxidase subunit 2
MNRTAEAVFSGAKSQFTHDLRRSGEVAPAAADGCFAGSRRWTGAAAAAVVALSAAQAQAQPLPWEMGLQPAATPVMANVHAFHDALLVLMALISGLVLVLLVYVITRFNAAANPVPTRTTHNTLVEVVWTVVPVVILIAIAIPSFRLLYFQREIPKADMTLKITGNQWNWTYDYPDNGAINLTAFVKQRAELKEGEPYLLTADTPTVVPVDKTVRIIVTASDVIHSWAMPAFGVKIDAVPGRLNEDWFKAEKVGTYYGQCSELCGKDHAFMPIMVQVVPEADFNAWAAKAKAAGVEEARKLLAARLATSGIVAASD